MSIIRSTEGRRDEAVKYQVEWHGIEKGKHVIKKHGIFNSEEEAEDSIFTWWKKNDFEPLYVIRNFGKDDAGHRIVILDYGSHMSFYHIVEVDG